MAALMRRTQWLAIVNIELTVSEPPSFRPNSLKDIDNVDIDIGIDIEATGWNLKEYCHPTM